MSTVLELLTPILEHTPGGVEHDQQRHAGGRGSESRGVDFIDNPNGQNIKMLRNPSVGQAIAAFHKSESSYRAGNIKQLRGITSGKNIWIWNAHKGTHADAAEALGLDYLEANSRNGLLTMNTEQHVRFYFGKMADGSDPFPATESIRDILEHFGPGPHEGTGTPQSEHAGGRGKKVTFKQDMRGEWWLEGGRATFADGDIGDLNHEQVVMLHVMNNVQDELGSDDKLASLGMTLETIVDEGGISPTDFRSAIVDWADGAHREGIFTDDEVDDIYDTIVQRTGITKRELDVLTGNLDDAREYGLENLGWVRVHGNNVQAHGITKSSLETIADGLWDAYDEQVQTQSWNIEDAKTGKFYRNVPWPVVSDGDVGALRRGLFESLCSFLEHMGPGPHPSGSPQSEHAGGEGGSIDSRIAAAKKRLKDATKAFDDAVDDDAAAVTLSEKNAAKKKLIAAERAQSEADRALMVLKAEKEIAGPTPTTAKGWWRRVRSEQDKYDELDRRNVKLGEKLDEADATVREMHDHDSMVKLKEEEVDQLERRVLAWQDIHEDQPQKGGDEKSIAKAARKIDNYRDQLEHSKAQLQGMRDEAVKKTTAAFIAGNKLDKLRDERREVQNMMAEQDDRIRNATQTAEVFELSENEGKPLGRLAENLRAKNGNQGLLDSMRKDMGGAKDAIMSQPHVSASARVQGGVYGDGEIRASQELRGEIKKGIVENVSGGLIAKADASDISNASADIVAVREAGGRYNADAMEHAGILRDQKKGRSNIDHARVVSQNIVDSWAKSSTNGNATSVAMQIAVKRKFGDREAIKGMAEATSTEGFELYSNNRKVFDALADSIYEDTQAKLKAAGVDEVTLFRGMSLSRDEVGEDVVYHLGQKNFAAMDVDIDMNPISSFSTHYGDAKTFSSASNKDYGSLTAVRVPRKRIFCTAFNGLGCVTEAEVLVTGEAPLHGKIMVGESYAAQSLSTYFDWLNQKGLQVSE